MSLLAGGALSPLAVLQKMLNRELSRNSMADRARSDCVDVPPNEAVKRLETLLLSILRSLLGVQDPRKLGEEESDWQSDEGSEVELEEAATSTQFPKKLSPMLARMICVIELSHSLLIKDCRLSKRDVYYKSKRSFKNQDMSDRILERLCALVNLPAPYSLNIIPSDRGRIRGEVVFYDGRQHVCASSTKTSIDGIALPPRADKVTNINVQTTVQYCLVVEKEAVFAQLSREDFCLKRNCLLVTAMGYPDIATRSFLNKLSQLQPAIPIFCLTDGDADGISIFLTYKYGSAVMQHAVSSLAVPTMRWLGVFPSDVVGERSMLKISQAQYRFDGVGSVAIPMHALLPVTAHDRRKLTTMAKRSEVQSDPTLRREVSILQERGKKVEIECLTSVSAYFLGVYVERKIETGRWA